MSRCCHSPAQCISSLYVMELIACLPPQHVSSIRITTRDIVDQITISGRNGVAKMLGGNSAFLWLKSTLNLQSFAHSRIPRDRLLSLLPFDLTSPLRTKQALNDFLVALTSEVGCLLLKSSMILVKAISMFASTESWRQVYLFCSNAKLQLTKMW